ncbi:MAG: 4Fe-4S dicluster domain-containing protein [Bacillota bacterium]
MDLTELKKGGFLRQKQKDMYVMRFRTISGNITSEDLAGIAGLAEKYGRGYVHVTTRQGMEIPWVHISDYQKLQEEIKALGLLPGTCGPRIRTVIACPGSEICTSGLVDSRRTGEELDRVFFGREVPMKTKMAVSGCPNSCAKPQENDVGFVGIVEPAFAKDLCAGCGLCAEICPGRAISMVNDLPVLDAQKCLYEGNCIKICPSDAWSAQRVGYRVFAGGKIGRKPQLGSVVWDFILEDQVIETGEAILDIFRSVAQKGERLADTVSRIGVETFRAELEERLEPSAALLQVGG